MSHGYQRNDANYIAAKVQKDKHTYAEAFKWYYNPIRIACCIDAMTASLKQAAKAMQEFARTIKNGN
jgi:hypothetical protein